MEGMNLLIKTSLIHLSLLLLLLLLLFLHLFFRKWFSKVKIKNNIYSFQSLSRNFNGCSNNSRISTIFITTFFICGRQILNLHGVRSYFLISDIIISTPVRLLSSDETIFHSVKVKSYKMLKPK